MGKHTDPELKSSPEWLSRDLTKNSSLTEVEVETQEQLYARLELEAEGSRAQKLAVQAPEQPRQHWDDHP